VVECCCDSRAQYTDGMVSHCRVCSCEVVGCVMYDLVITLLNKYIINAVRIFKKSIFFALGFNFD
jgi:hypothetical protein